MNWTDQRKKCPFCFQEKKHIAFIGEEIYRYICICMCMYIYICIYKYSLKYSYLHIYVHAYTRIHASLPTLWNKENRTMKAVWPSNYTNLYSIPNYETHFGLGGLFVCLFSLISDVVFYNSSVDMIPSAHHIKCPL